MSLSVSDEQLLHALLPELITANTVGIAVVGSFGRGNPRPESDVDITRLLTTLPAAETDRYQVHYQGGRMVGVVDTTAHDLREGIVKPQRAIWTVRLLRSARPLYDPSDQLQGLQEEAQAFRWEPLQPAANRYASHRLTKFAEEALKLAFALRARNDQRILTETIWLVLGLPLVVAVNRGILLENESRAPEEVAESIGLDAPWSQQYRKATGIGGATTVEERGYAALQLYALTKELLDSILEPEHRRVVEETLRRARRVLADSARQ